MLVEDYLLSILRNTISIIYPDISDAYHPALSIPKIEHHGDFSSNIAMLLASELKKSSREVAQNIVKNIPIQPHIKHVVIAGPGFINFYLHPSAYYDVIADICSQGCDFGKTKTSNKKILLEFVSANPTGPLHVGHGRGAIYGDVLAELLKATGASVTKEYYLNDCGRQVDILAISIWLRYLSKQNITVPFPTKAYQGDYIKNIAGQIKKQYEESYIPQEPILQWPHNDDEEVILDQYIQLCKKTLQTAYKDFRKIGVNAIKKNIENDLNSIGVQFDNWFSENRLVEEGKVKQVLQHLIELKITFEKDGAIWLYSEKFGDEKNHVLVRNNGEPTYFASDIAYHLTKYERKYDHMINLWGADHHGYMARLLAAIKAMQKEEEKLEILLIQFANLVRNKQKVQMSTRTGEYTELKTLIEEVGKDATRFFYLARKNDQHLEFDLDIAKENSNNNPVYYIQYAHARITSIWQKAQEKNINYNSQDIDLTSLVDSSEIKLLKKLSRYPSVIKSAAQDREPHQLCTYLKELAAEFHNYYNKIPILSAEDNVKPSRLLMLQCIQQVLKNGLSLLGITAPKRM